MDWVKRKSEIGIEDCDNTFQKFLCDRSREMGSGWRGVWIKEKSTPFSDMKYYVNLS